MFAQQGFGQGRITGEDGVGDLPVFGVDVTFLRAGGGEGGDAVAFGRGVETFEEVQ